VVDIAPGLRAEGITIKAVRLDSGDLAQHAHRVRAILDEGGCEEIHIFCSGNLDEFRIRELIEAKAPVDGFGVGTHLDVSIDAPSIDCVYKLQEYAGRACRKRSSGKATWPGRKQVFRSYKDDGIMARDILTLEDDPQGGEPLLVNMMQGGTRVQPSPPLTKLRERAATELGGLPEHLRKLESPGSYQIEVSHRLRELTREVDRALA
jgi:nicotinate phosphoribosyltransferase